MVLSCHAPFHCTNMRQVLLVELHLLQHDFGLDVLVAADTVMSAAAVAVLFALPGVDVAVA